MASEPYPIISMRLMEPNTPAGVANWCGGKVCGVGAVGEKVWIEVQTDKGTEKANYGDVIVKIPGYGFKVCTYDVLEKLPSERNDIQEQSSI